MADGEPVTAAELAERTGTHERMLREWLANQAAGGYVTHDPGTDRFQLSTEHALALAREDSPVFVQGLFDLVAAMYQSIDKAVEALRTGRGLTWAGHVLELYEATERCFAAGYRTHMVEEWIPALTGIRQRLEAGGGRPGRRRRLRTRHKHRDHGPRPS